MGERGLSAPLVLKDMTATVTTEGDDYGKTFLSQKVRSLMAVSTVPSKKK